MTATSRAYLGNIRAPEFPPNLEWLNTGRPLTLAELRGKLVLLDFWTYGCINCIHVIPDLKRLEAEFPEELVVIGVHSAKFANERQLDNIRQIVLRYELEHPVVNDRYMEVWSAYAVRAWPTTVLIDPTGRVLAAHSGEGVYGAHADLIARAMAEYRASGLLKTGRLDLTTERSRVPETALSFPGKVLADEDSDRLFIADTNHHRIVVATLGGRVLDVIGSGRPGLTDGAFPEAALRKPQGMALAGNTLYVADTDNHAIRAADLAARTLRTLAGDGTLGYRQAAEGASARLNSPWDVVVVGEALYVAMAGAHQLWRLDLAAGAMGPYAGSGREGLLDGPLVRAALAQPSGLASDGRVFYFADSEASAVRSADLTEAGQVRTIVGEGLFEFGDVDGDWSHARLQHPLGIAYHRETLFVADTYNHKLKIVDPESGRVSTWLGQGAPGWGDGAEPFFYEPGGLSGAGAALYVADTNNHVIRVVDLNTQTVRALALEDPQGLLVRLGRGSAGKVVRLPEQRVRAGRGMVWLDVALPTGLKFNSAAPSRIAWPDLPALVRLAGDLREVDLRERAFPLGIQATFQPGRAMLRAELAIYYCESDESVCLIDLALVELPLTVVAVGAPDELRITLPIPLPG
ncbi:MAG: thioredoxin-like domain-containing protein [Chloroflexota bacterium]